MSRDVVYDKLKVEVYDKESKAGPITADVAKALLGWKTEDEAGIKFKEMKNPPASFRDFEGNNVICENNPTNRPFRMGLAKRYANEFIRGKWRLNGEPVIVDRRGHIQSGQHRLIGLVLAEQMRTNPKTKEFWANRAAEGHAVKGPVKAEMLLVLGISEKPEVVDTLDGGQKRSLGDVIYRDGRFASFTPKQQKGLANVLAGAIRHAWLRTGGKNVSSSPWFPRSEALDFLDMHPGLVDAVALIVEEDAGSGEEGDTKRIRSLLSPAYAASWCYLMTIAKTKSKKFEETGEVDMSLAEKAHEFWSTLASGAGLEKDNPILVLRNWLTKGDKEAGSALGRDVLNATIAKAWNAWVDGRKLTTAELKVKLVKDADGNRRISDEDNARIGGLDVAVDPVDVPKPGKAEKPAKAPKATEPKGRAAKEEGGKSGTEKPSRKRPVQVEETAIVKPHRAGEEWAKDDIAYLDVSDDPEVTDVRLVKLTNVYEDKDEKIKVADFVEVSKEGKAGKQEYTISVEALKLRQPNQSA